MRESLHPQKDYSGFCLKAVREMLLIPVRDPSAKAAWEATPDRHRHQGMPPPGAPVFFQVGKFWHVALSAGFWLCWSTDVLRKGRFDVLPISEVERLWGAQYLGWSTTLNGKLVPGSISKGASGAASSSRGALR
jgi:hypothetical protein